MAEPSAGAPHGSGSAPWLRSTPSSSPGIDLENIVYYKDDTHYFVMTAKKQSLLKKGVILQVRRAGSSPGIPQKEPPGGWDANHGCWFDPAPLGWWGLQQPLPCASVLRWGLGAAGGVDLLLGRLTVPSPVAQLHP